MNAARTAGKLHRRHHWWATGFLIVGLGALAAYFVFAWDLTTGHGGVLSLDTYGYYYPNMLQVRSSLAAGGRGLLWNALQDCGQPFFGIGSTGILYPLNALFLVMDPNRALRAVIVLNLLIAGLGAYALCRELGASRPAAACGAVAFELANATLDLSTWTPLACSPYVWFPTVLLFCERSLRNPSLANAVGLGASLAVALLPGFPQAVFFAYQIIALRVLWEIALRRRTRPLAILATVGTGLALAPLLTAAQLVPAAETARQSVRSRSLSPEELAPLGPLTWAAFRQQFGHRDDVSNPLIVLPAMVAAASLASARTRRRALPYAVIGALFFALALGTSTPVFDLYARLPLGNLFRFPERFIWVVDFCLAVLAGLGLDALRTAGEENAGFPRRCLPLAVAAVALVVLYALSPVGLRPTEWILAAVLVAAAGAAAVAPAWSRAAAAVMVVAVVANLAAFPLYMLLSPATNAWSLRPITPRRLFGSGVELRAGAPVLGPLHERLTGQERVYLVSRYHIAALLPKVPAQFGIPGVLDYEPQPTQRYAAYLVMMRTGQPMESLNDYYFPTLFGVMRPGVFRRRLLDLAAARYLVAAERVDTTAAALAPPPDLLSSAAGLRLYQNTLALQRAFYVPRVEVVHDADALLARLADGSDDLRQVAFVEETPPSGFTGVPGNVAAGTVEFVRNDPEHLVLRVRAPERGFLHLADQYANGWRATVNGAPAPILRGDFLFRLVEVPQGESIVEFVYRPVSLLVGILISMVTTIIASALLLRRRRRGTP